MAGYIEQLETIIELLSEGRPAGHMTAAQAKTHAKQVIKRAEARELSGVTLGQLHHCLSDGVAMKRLFDQYNKLKAEDAKTSERIQKEPEDERAYLIAIDWLKRWNDGMAEAYPNEGAIPGFDSHGPASSSLRRDPQISDEERPIEERHPQGGDDNGSSGGDP